MRRYPNDLSVTSSSIYLLAPGPEPTCLLLFYPLFPLLSDSPISVTLVSLFCSLYLRLFRHRTPLPAAGDIRAMIESGMFRGDFSSYCEDAAC